MRIPYGFISAAQPVKPMGAQPTDPIVCLLHPGPLRRREHRWGHGPRDPGREVYGASIVARVTLLDPRERGSNPCVGWPQQLEGWSNPGRIPEWCTWASDRRAWSAITRFGLARIQGTEPFADGFRATPLKGIRGAGSSPRGGARNPFRLGGSERGLVIRGTELDHRHGEGRVEGEPDGVSMTGRKPGGTRCQG